jgi:hypothetical protein
MGSSDEGGPSGPPGVFGPGPRVAFDCGFVGLNLTLGSVPAGARDDYPGTPSNFRIRDP